MTTPTLSDRFECILAPESGLDTAIAYAREHGMFMDSSWRNKNALRCPLTILCTINEYHRMVPSKFSVPAIATS
jgi:hypothetical protein